MINHDEAWWTMILGRYQPTLTMINHDYSIIQPLGTAIVNQGVIRWPSVDHDWPTTVNHSNHSCVLTATNQNPPEPSLTKSNINQHQPSLTNPNQPSLTEQPNQLTSISPNQPQPQPISTTLKPLEAWNPTLESWPKGSCAYAEARQSGPDGRRTVDLAEPWWGPC